jgi:hypothetical protein
VPLGVLFLLLVVLVLVADVQATSLTNTLKALQVLVFHMQLTSPTNS